MLADTPDTTRLCRARCGLISLASNTSRMVPDAVPDRSRAAPPDQGVLVISASRPNAWPCEQSEVSFYLFHAYQTYFFIFRSRASRVVLFRSQICVILLQLVACHDSVFKA